MPGNIGVHAPYRQIQGSTLATPMQYALTPPNIKKEKTWQEKVMEALKKGLKNPKVQQGMIGYGQQLSNPYGQPPQGLLSPFGR